MIAIVRNEYKILMQLIKADRRIEYNNRNERKSENPIVEGYNNSSDEIIQQ
jgi:hypothetical protein